MPVKIIIWYTLRPKKEKSKRKSKSNSEGKSKSEAAPNKVKPPNVIRINLQQMSAKANVKATWER